jgi:magnesium chelatase family protein
VPPEELQRASQGESSATVRVRVVEAHERARKRQGKANAELTTREIEKHCSPDERGTAILKQAIGTLRLSARGYHRILKVARTIADLAGVVAVSTSHIAEAIQYRRFDRQ